MIGRKLSTKKTPRTVLRHLRKAGETVLVTGPRQLSLVYDNSGRVRLYHRQKGHIQPRVIFHWVQPATVGDLLDILEFGGFRLINPVKAWRAGQNKAMQLGVFEREGIPHPWSAFTRGSWRQLQPLKNWQKQRFVIKPHNAGRGRLVHRVRGDLQAQKVHDRLQGARGASLIQAYIDTGRTPRYHYRVDVIGGRAVTGGVAFAQKHPWITNEARGGRFEFSPDLRRLPEEVQRLAERAALALGADYSGVDIMQDRNGALYVLEANEWPLFETRTSRYLAQFILRAGQRSATSDPSPA